jgi:hypothetical protein
MQRTQRIGFHESTIVGVHNGAGSVTVELDGVHFDDSVRTASIRVMGIKTITRDEIPVAELLAECEDGEVLTLQYTDFGGDRPSAGTERTLTRNNDSCNNQNGRAFRCFK